MASTFGPIAIGFSTRKKNILSTIIRWATGSKASHVWLLTSLFGVPCVVEASDFGFFPSMTFERFKQANEIVSLIPIEQSLDEGLTWAAKSFGERYDYTGLFGMIVVMLGRFFHRRWKNPLDNRKALFCSEAIASVLVLSRYPNSEQLVPEETTPDQLLQLLES
jgi:hypothetical protein